MDIKNKPHNEKQNKNKRKQNEFWLIIPQCDLLALSNICRTTHATNDVNFNQKRTKKKRSSIFPANSWDVQLTPRP